MSYATLFLAPRGVLNFGFRISGLQDCRLISCSSFALSPDCVHFSSFFTNLYFTLLPAQITSIEGAWTLRPVNPYKPCVTLDPLKPCLKQTMHRAPLGSNEVSLGPKQEFLLARIVCNYIILSILQYNIIWYSNSKPNTPKASSSTKTLALDRNTFRPRLLQVV